MAQKHLQLLRNGSAYADYQAAYNALITKTTYADGTPILARYSGATGEIKTLLGVVNKASGVTTPRVDIINDVQASILRAYNLEDATSGAIKTNDSIEVALNKLENQVKAAKAAATTKVVEGTDEGNNMTIVPSTGDDNSVTYTVSLTDVASKAALTQEISDREDGDEALDARLGTGVTSANTATAQLAALSGNNSSTSAETSVEGAKRYTDDKVSATLNALDYNLASGASAAVVHINQTDGAVSAASVNVDTLLISDYAEGSDAKLANTDSIAAAFGKVQGQINAMDLSVVSGAGEVITAVSEADGKVSAEKTAIKDVTLTGYVKDTTKTGALAATDDIKDALSKIENNIEAAKQATTVASADKSINVTTATTGTDINVNIKSGEKVLAKDGNDGLYTDIKLSAVTPSSTAIKEEYSLIATDGTALGTNIKIYKDSHIVSITYITDSSDAHYQNLEYKYIDASGNTQTEYVDISSLVLEAEFASGVTVTDHVAHGVVDPTSETFLTVGADGFKLAGVQDAIDTAISGLDFTTDAAVAGQYVAAIEETDGIVAVKTRANVSDAVLTGYAKGEKPASTTIAATDDVKGAIAKLEHQIDDAKAVATTVVEHNTGNTHVTVSSSKASDGHTIYTVNEDDIASATALTAEVNARIAAIEALDVTGDTAVAGQYVAAIEETDGVVAVKARANVSEAVLNNYSKGTDATTVAATDTVNQAIGKLENQIDGVKEGYLTGVTVNGVTGNVADNVATVVISGSSINLGTGYTGNESGAPTTADTVNQAIAKLYNKSNANTSTGKTITITSGESSTNFEVNVDNTTTATTAMALYESANHNAIQDTTNGLYVSSIWDCGTYDEPAGN